MTSTFINSYENAVNSRLAFDVLSPNWKRQLIFRSIVISCLLLVFLIYITYTTKLGTSIVINNNSFPIASLIIDTAWIIPVSVVAGWGDYKFSLSTRKNALLVQYEGLPSDYFGITSVSINQDGLAFQMPLSQGKLSWKLIDTIKTAQGYLFFCRNNQLVLSMPLSALENNEAEFISIANSFISSNNNQSSVAQ